MKGNRIAPLLFVSILMIAAPVQLFNTVTKASSHSLRLNPLNALAYEPHDFIYIDGDVDFAETALDEGWDGDGSVGDPYIIEGYNITTAEYCIRIFSTTAHFIIRNCYLRPLDEWDSGIYFSDVVNGYVDSCHIDSGDLGMSLYYCFDSTVANTLVQCSAIALDLEECQYNLFANNTFQGGGLSTWTMNEDSFLNTFYNNTVNGLPLGYFRGISDQTIDGDLYGQVVLASCDNVTVDGGNFHDTWQGPMIFFSTGCTLENANVQDCALGVHLMFSPETKILNNIIRNSHHIGVLSNTSDSVEIRNNEIYSNPVGIEASEFVFLIIDNNTIHGGYSGIVAFIGGLAEITQNRIYDNSNYGIRLAYWASNVTIHNNMLGWNGVSNGYDEEPANLWDDDVSQGNYWDDYGGVGTYPIPGPGGSVDRYPQVLVDSTPPSVLGPDDIVFEVGTTGNILRWGASDYFPHLFEIVKNETLFADGPWNSSADIIEVNVDSLPIGVHNFTITFFDRSYQNSTDSVLVTVLPDENPPIVSSPDDITYEEGESGFNIVWNATDANPLLYTLFIDEVPVRSSAWNSTFENVVVSVDNLPLGTYNYTIMFTDGGLLNASDEVDVTVNPDTTHPIVAASPDVYYEENRTGNFISWSAYDANPGNYSVFKDESLIAEGVWNSTSETVVVDVDGLLIGSYNFTVVFRDLGNRSTADTVMVYVFPDTFPPEISTPGDVTCREGDTGYSILWIADDANPSSYLIERDGSYVTSGAWNSSSEAFFVSVDGLPIGVYAYNLTLWDTNGNSAFDIVLVNVLEKAVSPHSPISINGDTQFASQADAENWEGFGTPEDPYIIEWYEVITSTTCISIVDVTVHFIIRDCNLFTTSYGYGIFLAGTMNGVIDHCNVTSSNYCIAMQDCTNITIQNSTTQSDTGMDFFSMFSNDCSFYNNNFESGVIFVGSNPLNYRHTMQNNTAGGLPLGYFWQETGFDIDASDYGQIVLANCSDGILRNGTFDSLTAAVTIAYGCDVTVEDTDFSNCLVAIWVQESVLGGVYNCQFASNQYCIMTNFTTGFNIVDNIFQTSMFLSLYIIMCDSSVVGGNLFEFNEQCIMAMQCSNIEITSNQFFNTSMTAVTLSYYCTGFLVYDNEFGDNGQHAQDDGSANLWDDTVSVGNAWDDYDGSPPYSIPGSAMSVDRFPRFLVPVAAPTIDSPADIFYVQGSIGHIITWTPSSMIPGLFMVYRNGTLVASAIWNGLPIGINVDGFLSGAYNFTIVVFDTEGRDVSDTVWVFVSAPSTTTTITTSTTTNGTDIDLIMMISIAVTIGSAAVVIFVVVAVFRSRKDAMG